MTYPDIAMVTIDALKTASYILGCGIWLALIVCVYAAMIISIGGKNT